MKLCFKRLYAITFALGLSWGVTGASVLYAQADDLQLKANELVFSNPEEAIKIAEVIMKSHEGEDEIQAQMGLLLAKCYWVKGEYKQAVDWLFNASARVAKNNYKERAAIGVFKVKLLRELQLQGAIPTYSEHIADWIDEVASARTKDSLRFRLELEQLDLDVAKDKAKTLGLLEQMEQEFGEFLSSSPEDYIAFYLAKEVALQQTANYESAMADANKALKLIDQSNSNNLYSKAMAFKAIGALNHKQGAFRKSEETLFIALKFAEILDNRSLLKEINQELALNYLSAGQNNQHKVYNYEFLLLNKEVEVKEREAVNTLYNLIGKENEAAIAASENRYKEYIYMAVAGFLLVIGIGLLVLLKSYFKKRRLGEIIRYLEINRTNLAKIKPAKRKTVKKLVIPEETEKTILSKLKKFQNSRKFLSKDMSIAVLAGQFETNTKYLSEIINKHYNDNFNTFINKLRINYIIEKLKEDPNYINYKISVLAEECGFSSHSSFATVFKNIVGMPPATYINLLKEERNEERNEELSNN
ncbi:AraC family transcriptional regulator [Mangrovimonas sp. TPBH4]|uniref:helix-turn-helix domain-containing protein n=1 Tax=Mangrovimonas sp. TPBH4 TaxID=1645914 RepID=UPI0006B57109|nr:AraC family transcriptional regulator [Mangrovimonas sp. TPBH4]